MKNHLSQIELLLSFLFFIACVFAFGFLYQRVESNNAQAEETQLALETLVAKVDVAKTLNQTLESISRDQAKLEESFVSSLDIVPFLDSIESTARGIGIISEVTSVAINEEEKVLLVEVRANGSFARLYQFLTLLEQAPYEIKFDSVDLAIEDNAGVSTSARLWKSIFRIRLTSFNI